VPLLRKVSAEFAFVPKSVNPVTNCPKMMFCEAIPTPDATAAKAETPRRTHSTGPAYVKTL